MSNDSNKMTVVRGNIDLAGSEEEVYQLVTFLLGGEVYALDILATQGDYARLQPPVLALALSPWISYRMNGW